MVKLDIYFLIKSRGSYVYLLALIIGGSLGNLFDRMYYYAVPDFIDLHLANYHWFIFNVADIFIFIGIPLSLITSSLDPFSKVVNLIICGATILVIFGIIPAKFPSFAAIGALWLITFWPIRESIDS